MRSASHGDCASYLLKSRAHYAPDEREFIAPIHKTSSGGES